MVRSGHSDCRTVCGCRAFTPSGLAGDWNFIKRWAMKLLPTAMLLGIPLLLSACLYGQCINGPCSFERERILNSIKAYGEYFEPGMTKEGWRADWVACGGRSNGTYAVDLPHGSTNSVINTAIEKTTQQLSTCMQSKGYQYQPNPK
jgi:hypothetical protein